MITERQAPPRNGMSRPKMRYAHQGGVNPPVVVIHGSNLVNIPDSYTRYLEAQPVQIVQTGRHPIAGSVQIDGQSVCRTQAGQRASGATRSGQARKAVQEEITQQGNGALSGHRQAECGMVFDNITI